MNNEPITILDVALTYTAFVLLLNALSATWWVMQFTARQLRLLFRRAPR